MLSSPQKQSLALAREIVKTDDPEALATAARIIEMDDESLIELRGAVQDVLRREREAFADRIRTDVFVDQICGAVMLRRILDRKAKMLPSDTHKCAIEYSKKPPSKRFDVLSALFGKVPAQRLKDAIWKTVAIDAKKIDPDVLDRIEALVKDQPHGVTVGLDADATKLKKLRDDFGGEVAEIVNAGLVYEQGAPILVFERLPQVERNVTPMECAS